MVWDGISSAERRSRCMSSRLRTSRLTRSYSGEGSADWSLDWNISQRNATVLAHLFARQGYMRGEGPGGRAWMPECLDEHRSFPTVCRWALGNNLVFAFRR